MEENYKGFAIALAKKAGEIIRQNFVLEIKENWKEDNTIVTETDLKINRLVIDSVKSDFPRHGVLAEEEKSVSGEEEYLWVCDPLDGTHAFSRGIPTSTFSLALAKNGESLLGVVYDPFLDKMFVAEKGKGAYVNGNKIFVSQHKSFERAFMCVLNWKNAKFDFAVLRDLLTKQGADIYNLGSVAYQGMLVASGKFDAVVFPGTLAHDTAAVKVIVEEAGGKVTDLSGNEPLYDRESNGSLISNGHLHSRLLELIKENVSSP